MVLFTIDLVEAAGIEPAIRYSSEKPNAGRNPTKDGRKVLKAGQTKGLTNVAHLNLGTLIGQPEPSSGPSKATTKPQPAHNRHITGADLPQGLQTIIDAWPDLPKEVKAGILAMVKTVKK